MIKIARRLFFFAVLVATTSLALIALQAHPAMAQSETFCDGPCPIDQPPPSNCDGPCPIDQSPPPSQSPVPTPTDGGSSGRSISGLADQRFNQMITNQVLGNVLLGVNEQINCNDCVSAFGSVGSFTAGVHGRKQLTNNLSLLAGLAYTQYSEGGYHVTSAPIGAFALRYDFIDWGSSRPFFDIGTIVSPFQKVRYSRNYIDEPRRGVARQFDRQLQLRGLWPRGLDQPLVAARRGRGLRRNLAAMAARRGLCGPGIDVQSVRCHDRHRHRPHQSGQGRRAMDPPVRLQRGRQHQRRPCAVVCNHSGIVAAVTGDGIITPTMGNQAWFEYGGRLGFRITQGWVADVFVNGTAGPQPVGNTIHGGVGLRIHY